LPVSLAPASTVRSPWMWTSPLNRPASRMCPEPSIVPSIERSDAMTDSRASRGAIRRGALGLGVMSLEKSGSLLSAGSEGGVIVGASFLGEVVSFQIAMFDVLLESRTNTGRLTRLLLPASPFTKCYPRATISLGRQRAVCGKLVTCAQGRDEKSACGLCRRAASSVES